MKMRNKKRPNPSTRLMTIQEENEKEEKYDIAEAYKGQPVPTFDTADGPFIVTGFRPQLSLLNCLLSMFTCHIKQSIYGHHLPWPFLILECVSISMSEYSATLLFFSGSTE